ncbi:MAG: hypothetical protein CTY12_00200 [Methylotenera sp.]|nr:MAG: hypothetical protein CTY12_00200 [Methylotenera sp.]
MALTTGPSEFHPTTENEKFAIKLFKSTARSAKRRNIEFNISYPHLLSLINSTTVCPILDVQLVIGNTHKTKNTTPSIDRVNNNVGYIDNNIQIISWKANYLKRDATIVELNQIINYIKKHDNNT